MKSLSVAIAFAGLLFLTVSALGEITLIGPDQAEVGSSFEVAVDGLELSLEEFTQGSKSPPQIEWRVVPERSAALRSHLELMVAVGKGNKPVWVVVPYATVRVLEPGTTGVLLMAVRNGVGTLAVLEVAVGPFPPPPPPPPPDKLWGAFLIEETDNRTAEQARVITSKKLRAYCREQKIHWIVHDKDVKDAEGNTPEETAPYVKLAKEHGFLPVLFVVGDDGGLFYAGKLPDTADAVIALLGKHAGKKESKQ